MRFFLFFLVVVFCFFFVLEYGLCETRHVCFADLVDLRHIRSRQVIFAFQSRDADAG